MTQPLDLFTLPEPIYQHKPLPFINSAAFRPQLQLMIKFLTTTAISLPKILNLFATLKVDERRFIDHFPSSSYKHLQFFNVIFPLLTSHGDHLLLMPLRRVYESCWGALPSVLFSPQWDGGFLKITIWKPQKARFSLQWEHEKHVHGLGYYWMLWSLIFGFIVFEYVLMRPRSSREWLSSNSVFFCSSDYIIYKKLFLIVVSSLDFWRENWPIGCKSFQSTYSIFAIFNF